MREANSVDKKQTRFSKPLFYFVKMHSKDKDRNKALTATRAVNPIQSGADKRLTNHSEQSGLSISCDRS